MQVLLLKLKLEELVVRRIRYLLKLVVLEEQIYHYDGLFVILVNELEEVCQLN
jgi:hypothetical protein